MICTKKPLTQTKSLSSQESKRNQKQQLIARWKTINGKLVCQWVNFSNPNTQPNKNQN